MVITVPVVRHLAQLVPLVSSVMEVPSQYHVTLILDTTSPVVVNLVAHMLPRHTTLSQHHREHHALPQD